MAVGGEDVLAIEFFAISIAFCLLHAFQRIFILLLRFEDCDFLVAHVDDED